MTPFEVAKEIGRRLSSIFLSDGSGRCPVFGETKKFQEDPYSKNYILFWEDFHGDNGAGLGANHQTGTYSAQSRSVCAQEPRRRFRAPLGSSTHFSPSERA
jgi:hypothetical protein